MPENPATTVPAPPPLGLDIRGILRVLPHRYPMLMVDRIDSLEPGVCAEGVKNVSANEPFMVGHFPDYPIMPGVLIVDALAQTAGIMLRTKPARPAPVPAEATAEPRQPGMLAAIPKMRFLRPVFPGDQLLLQVRLMKSFAGLHRIDAKARVGDQLVATGELILSS